MHRYSAVCRPMDYANPEQSPVPQIKQFDDDGRNDYGPQESIEFHAVRIR